MNVFSHRPGVTKPGFFQPPVQPVTLARKRLLKIPEAISERSSKSSDFVLSQPQTDTLVLPGLDSIKYKTQMLSNFTPANVGNLSTSQLVAALAPGARVVKALNNMIVPNLEADPVVNGARRVAFISADDDGAKKRVETLLEGFGYSVIDLGNLRDGGLIQQAGGPLAGRDFLERGES